MNGYSHLVKAWSNDRLIREHKRHSEASKFSGPAQDSLWLYRAILEEMRERGVETDKQRSRRR